MFQTVPILLGCFFTVVSSYAAGFLLLQWARVTLFREEQHFFRFVLGSACLSLAVFALTAAHLAYRNAFLVVGFAITAVALYRFRAKSAAAVPLPDFSLWWKLIFGAVLCVYGVIYFAHALGPESSPDGATYHLGLVGRYLRQHGFGRITTDMYANLSEGIEMLFLIAFSIGRHSAAALVEFCYLVAIPWGMLCYGRRIGYLEAGVFGALVVFASPVFGMSGTVAYNDAAGVCVLFALFYLLQIWVLTRQARLIPLIGIAAGFCYGAKYTLFLALPFAGIFLLWHLLRTHRPWLQPLLIYSASALLFVLPWMVKNWIVVRNPFSPFANVLFPNPYITIHFEQQYSEFMRHPSDMTWAQRPLEHILHGNSGLLGPLFLLAPLAFLALRFSAGRQLFVAALVFLLPAYTNAETRFLMPMAPFLALSLGLALANVPGAVLTLLVFHLVTSWPTLIPSYAAQYSWHLNAPNFAASFRLVPEKVTLQKAMPEFSMAELLDQKTPPNARIFSFDNVPEAYTTRNIVIMYESALGNLLGEMLWTPLFPEKQPTQASVFTFASRSVQKLRLMQTGLDRNEMWSISEIRLAGPEGELVRDPKWRIQSSVNPWDIPFAFDNNPVTQWSTMEPIRPGMFLELDLGRPQTLTSVTLEAMPQPLTHVRVETEIAANTWLILSGEPEVRSRNPGYRLRQSAMAELKARGFTHVVVGWKAIGRDDFAAKLDEWGLQLIGNAHGFTLYRIL